MTPNEYQNLAGRTLISAPDNEYTGTEIMLVWNALGLTGEAGEVADMIKKSVFHRHELDTEKLMKELGDVLWYVAAICSKLEWSLEDVMAINIKKLMARYPAGYSSEASKARVDASTEKEIYRCFYSELIFAVIRCGDDVRVDVIDVETNNVISQLNTWIAPWASNAPQRGNAYYWEWNGLNHSTSAIAP